MRGLNQQYVESRVDAMKMTQSSLQQLMTLSAGGLALYFSFITNAVFLESLQIIGVIVVWCWIGALSMAAVGHKMLGDMASILQKLSTEVTDVMDMIKSPLDKESKIKKHYDPDAVVEGLNNLQDEALEKIETSFEKFSEIYFPIQDKVYFLVKISFSLMVIGFIAIGIGYTKWALSSPLTNS